MSSVPPQRPGSPIPPERPELPDGIEPPPSAPAAPAATRPIEFLPPAGSSAPPPDAEAPWPPWTAFAALFGAFALALVGGVIVAAVGAAFGSDLADPPPAVNIISTVVQDVAFVVVPLLFARMAVGRIELAQFGLSRTPLWPAVGATVAMMVAYFVLSGLWAAALNLDEPDQLPDSLGVEDSTAALVAVCVLVTVIAPIAEEFLFRGFMFGALRNWRGPLVSALITGILFGAIHAGSADVEFLVPLALLGVMLALLRWRTGSLLPCMVVHAFNNSIAFGVNAADWNAWQVILLIIGSNAVILLLSRPLLGPPTRRVESAAAR